VSDAANMLAEFHDALGDRRGRQNPALRITLHEEEHAELVEALQETDLRLTVVTCSPREAVEHVARELADVVYLAYGTAHAFAIDLDAALAEVHRAAMSKLDPATMVVREDGKILKPHRVRSARHERGGGLMPLCDGFYCNHQATHVGEWHRGDKPAHAFYCEKHGRQAAKDPRVTVTPLKREAA
jgi:predicted HAD superfamily Cof-like phosphohydrolase